MAIFCRSLLSLLALAALGASNAVPTKLITTTARPPLPTEVYIRQNLTLGTAVGGALDLPTKITAAPKVKATDFAVQDANFLTISIINSNGGDLSTVHAYNPGSPTPVRGNGGAGRVGDGQTVSFVVPSGFAGNVAINDASFSAVTGDESLIEASFGDQGVGRTVSDLNISYVNGFSVAIVCWCTGTNLYAGCNKNLYDYNGCPSYNGQGSCRNPTRPGGVNAPTQFFSPCRGRSGPYTFPDDNNANTLNQVCRSNDFTCCIGSECPENPAQNS